MCCFATLPQRFVLFVPCASGGGIQGVCHTPILLPQSHNRLPFPKRCENHIGSGRNYIGRRKNYTRHNPNYIRPFFVICKPLKDKRLQPSFGIGAIFCKSEHCGDFRVLRVCRLGGWGCRGWAAKACLRLPHALGGGAVRAAETLSARSFPPFSVCGCAFSSVCGL